MTRKFELTYQAAVLATRPGDKGPVCLVSTGGGTLASTISKGLTDGIFYLARGYADVHIRIEAYCGRCAGNGRVPKHGTRNMFATKTCPACRGIKPEQPVADPISVSLGGIVGLRVSID